MPIYELIGLNEAVPQLLAPTSADTGAIVGSLVVGSNSIVPTGALHVEGNATIKGELSLSGFNLTDLADPINPQDGVPFAFANDNYINIVSINGDITAAQLITGTPDLIVVTQGPPGTTQINIGANVATSNDDLSFFSATTSAQLAGVLSDETGTGLAVFNNSPTLTVPNIADHTNAQHDHENAAGGGQLDSTLALSDSASLARNTDNLSFFSATTSAQLAGIISDETGSGLLVFSDSPVLTTPIINVHLEFNNSFTKISQSAASMHFDVALTGEYQYRIDSLPQLSVSTGKINLHSNILDVGNAHIQFVNDNFTIRQTVNDLEYKAISGHVFLIANQPEFTIALGSINFHDNSLLNAPHNHQNAAGGGQLDSTLALSDSASLARNSDNLSFFAATTSAQLAGIISDETGTGLLVFNNSPILLTPTIASFLNAQHNHENAAGGGQLDSTLALSDSANIARNSDNLSFFSATTSAQLAGIISDETGTGLLVFNDSPIILTPTIASFSNAQHDHQDAAGGGQLVATLALTASGIKDASTFLRGDDEWTPVSGAGLGDVNATLNIVDNSLIRGDGGAKGIQDSGIIIDDSDNVSGFNSLSFNDVNTTIFQQGVDLIIAVAAGGAHVKTVDGIEVFTLNLSGADFHGGNLLNALHDHENAAGGGQLDSTLVLSDSANLARNSDNLSFFSVTTSAQLSGIISDETGTGLLVFNNAPTLTLPNINSFANAQHDHEDADGGGQLDSTLALSDSASLARNSNNLSFFATTTSAQLAGIITNETGSGLLVFNITPILTLPNISSFANAQHNHQDAAGGVQLNALNALDASGTKDATTFLGGNNIWSVPPGIELPTWSIDHNADNHNLTNVRSILFNPEFDNGNSGAAKTIDWSIGDNQLLNLTDDVTLTFLPEPTGVSNLTLKLIQDPVEKNVTWPLNVKWEGGTPPTLPFLSADFTDAVVTGELDISSEDGTPVGIAFSPDGKIAYMIGDTTDTIYQYALSVPFIIASKFGVPKSLDISSEDTSPTDLAISFDGLSLLMVGGASIGIFQYPLSIAFDIESAGVPAFLDVSLEDAQPTGVAYNNDGSKVYMIGIATDSVYQYPLPTPLDITSYVLATVTSKSVSAQDTGPHGLTFNFDGSKMYMIGTIQDNIFQYTLSTLFDITTLSVPAASEILDISGEEGLPRGIAVKPNDTKVYLVGRIAEKIIEYSIGNAVNIIKFYFDGFEFNGYQIR